MADPMDNWHIVPCPECEKPLEIAAPSFGQKVVCPHCGEVLMIVSPEPLEIASVREEEVFLPSEV